VVQICLKVARFSELPMRPIAPLISLTLFSIVVGSLQAEEAPLEVKTAIDKGLTFLAKEGVAWKGQRKCSSCHQVPMALWSLNEGKKLGYVVDEKAIAELTEWVVAQDDPGKVFPKPAPKAETPKVEAPKAEIPEAEGAKGAPPKTETNVNQTPLMLALAFEAGETKSDAARERLTTMLSAVVKEQRPDGSWGLMYVWEPFGSTPDVITNLALLSLSSPSAPDLGEAGKAAQAKGLAWFTAAKTEETLQGSALKLLLWRRLGKPVAEQEPLVKQILGWQNSDGGWAQNKELKSDAYATGQALYVLMEAGVPKTDPAIAKAHAYLVKSQDASGSWAMISRAGGPGGKSAKNQAPIGYAGTAWAVMGLMRSSPAPVKSETPAGNAAK
jgi:hypothetical protein